MIQIPETFLGGSLAKTRLRFLSLSQENLEPKDLIIRASHTLWGDAYGPKLALRAL